MAEAPKTNDINFKLIKGGISVSSESRHIVPDSFYNRVRVFCRIITGRDDSILVGIQDYVEASYLSEDYVVTYT